VTIYGGILVNQLNSIMCAVMKFMQFAQGTVDIVSKNLAPA